MAEGASRLFQSNIGSMNYNVLRALIEEYDVLKLKSGAEIGVLYGDTSVYLLSAFPELVLFGVDPYLEYDGEPDRSHLAMTKFEILARHRLASFGDRSQLMKMTSVEAATRLPDRALDFVFIDALHTYEAVKEDIASWYPKVRPGGLLCGHDISWEGVQRAVSEFAEEKRCEVNYTPLASDIWFTFVQPDCNDSSFPVSRLTKNRDTSVSELTKLYGVTY